MFSKKKQMVLFFIVILLFVILAVPKIPQVATAFKTAALWINIAIPEGDWRPLDLFTPAPVLEKHSIESESLRTLMMHLYLPAKQDRSGAIIIYTPFVGGGIEDPRFVNAAKSFARAGFAVLLSSRTEDKLIMSAKDIQDVVSLFLFLEKHPRVNPKRIGLMGISYGAGPVIIAAADLRIQDRVHFVMSMSGYYDFKNSLRFIVTGQYSYKDIQGQSEPLAFTQEILKNSLEYHGINGELFESFVANPNRFEELFQNSPEIQEFGLKLSPLRVIDDIQARFFIIHSIEDLLIPHTESMRLADALQGRVPVYFTLLSLLEHGQPRPFTLENITKYYVPSLADSYIFLYNLLKEQWRQ
ncbi:hypothetical protein IIB49_01965 [Patescibacteria group bacterium]|nr:hypothetical protein [Patescibacteria group bacterium]